MRVTDYKAGGWVRYISDDAIELAKVREFNYHKGCTNCYGFYFEGQDYGVLFEKKEFKYSGDVANLIKRGERVVEIKKHYFICKSFTKAEFVKKFGGKE